MVNVHTREVTVSTEKMMPSAFSGTLTIAVHIPVQRSLRDPIRHYVQRFYLSGANGDREFIR
jgi:hypothetical protein